MNGLYDWNVRRACILANPQKNFNHNTNDDREHTHGSLAVMLLPLLLSRPLPDAASPDAETESETEPVEADRQAKYATTACRL